MTLLCQMNFAINVQILYILLLNNKFDINNLYNEVPGLANEVKRLCARRRKAKLLLLNNTNNVEHINIYRTLYKRVK